MTTSIAHLHDMNPLGQSLYPDGRVPWLDESPPRLTGKPDERTTGTLRHCAYCGSMHPADVAAALRAGARVEWADRKYGWPHKIYLHNVPNPHAGMLESRASQNYPPSDDEIKSGAWVEVQDGFDRKTGEPTYSWREAGKPAAATTWGKFYIVHLQDATPEDRETIQAGIGLEFEFENDGRAVKWHRHGASTGG